jgi:hypothetical protein
VIISSFSAPSSNLALTQQLLKQAQSVQVQAAAQAQGAPITPTQPTNPTAGGPPATGSTSLLDTFA